MNKTKALPRTPIHIAVYFIVLSALLLFGIQFVFASTVSYWSLEENSGTTAYDTIGSNDASFVGGPTWVPGKTGTGISLDGRNDQMVVSSDTSLDNLDELNLDLWIFPTSLGEGNQGWIAGKAKSGESLPNDGWLLRLNNSPNNSLVFAVDYRNSPLEVVTNSGAVTLNAWNHIKVTWDGSSNASGAKIYVNDTEATYNSQSNGSGSRVNDSRGSLRFGGDPRKKASFEGIIDEIKIGNKVVAPPPPVEGCTDPTATNYNPTAEVDDGSCT